jgi:hypothetical protein
VHFVLGEQNRGMQAVASEYFERLKKEGSPVMKKWRPTRSTASPSSRWQGRFASRDPGNRQHSSSAERRGIGNKKL